ncbi:RTA1 like protein-domain-containing protein [Dactylonectria estremocensis]|uniref:RTA1 like protein-domain-containing protein n=1 Tax=Dactylonectria estremocensis TaxID=1079267 RepID=A0A9P9D2J4_9HYPO|nr:RTA1 like protein-domain-containing protein [Dactylonectria estremocensis]
MSYEGLLKPVPGVKPLSSGVYLWRYVPNQLLAILFLILFMATFVYICWKVWRTRARFCIVFAIGCFMQMVGYGVRAAVKNDTDQLMPYCIQTMFILTAPVHFAATIYMMLGRVILHAGGAQHSPLKPSKITLIFVLGDIFSFSVQGGGSGLSVIQNVELSKWSTRIVVIGLMIQIIIFGLFCVLAIIWHRRMRLAPVSPIARIAGDSPDFIHWEADLWMLYSVSLLIMVRSVFRVVEYCQGHTGYALSHEWTLYVFDAALMFAAAVIFCWRFPGHLGKLARKDDGYNLGEGRSY